MFKIGDKVKLKKRSIYYNSNSRRQLGNDEIGIVSSDKDSDDYYRVNNQAGDYINAYQKQDIKLFTVKEEIEDLKKIITKTL